MSIYYDLYENPDKEGTEEQKLLHARVVPSGTYTTKEFVERVSMMHHIPHAQLVGSGSYHRRVADAVVQRIYCGVWRFGAFFSDPLFGERNH